MLIVFGGALTFISIGAKSFFAFYRLAKTGNFFKFNSVVHDYNQLGRLYKGGFERKMTKREASLILGIR